MNELKKANRHIVRFIENGYDLEEGISRIRFDLERVFHFNDIERISRQALRECYRDFEVWLNGIMLAQPPPDGVRAMYFGLYSDNGVINLYVSGARQWKLDDPDWACDRFYISDNSLAPELYRDISTVSSEYNGTGLYLAIAVLATLIREYTRSSMISLLDIQRKTLYLACGYDDGDLFNVGRLTDEGLQPPGHRWRFFR